MALTVELGINIAFPLDDPVAGVLDNTDFVLGGVEFVDVSNRVRSVSLARGKNRDLDRFNAGTLSVTFNNEDRAFDPLNTASPFIGNIVPRREVRVLAGTAIQYVGKVIDWNFTYEPNGRQSASIEAADAFTFLAQQEVTTGTATPQLTGERINTVLDMETVEWPTAERNIDTGNSNLGADLIEGNVLTYLQKVEQSEAGLLFIGKQGRVTFIDRLRTPVLDEAVLFSDTPGEGISFAPAIIDYGTEQLHNQVTVTSPNFTGTANGILSQTRYGIAEVTIETLLDDQVTVDNLAGFLLARFEEPQLRFQRIQVNIDKLSAEDQAIVNSIEIGDVTEVKLTPGNPPTGTQISRYGQVISINHEVEPGSHIISFGLGSLQTSLFVLDNTEFGKLDGAGVLAF
jgi:hypothetical protein